MKRFCTGIIFVLSIFLIITSCVTGPVNGDGSGDNGDSDDEKKQVLVWSDEFEYTGLPDPGKWSNLTGALGWNDDLQYYTDDRAENVYVSDGTLKITARQEAYDGSLYTSALIRSIDLGDWKYGRIEVRAKLPTGRGIWPAIWLKPTDEVYGLHEFASGEIDIMEHVGYEEDIVHGTVHTKLFNMNSDSPRTIQVEAKDLDSTFHDYAVEWEADEIRFYVDDVHYFTYDEKGSGSDSWPFDQRFFLILNVQVGGQWGGAHGVDDTIFPCSMEVEHVRVYEFVEDKPTYTVTAEQSTGGSIGILPVKQAYDGSDDVTLTAVPEAGYEFLYWTGSLSGNTNPVTVKTDRDISVKALFQKVGNIVVNPEFEPGYRGWTLYAVQAAACEYVIKNGQTDLLISDGGTEGWHIQYYQTGLNLEEGQKYLVTFEASCQTSRSVYAALAMNGAPYTHYGGATVNLSAVKQAYSFQVQMDVNDSDGRIQFDLGTSDDDVTLYSVTVQKL